MHIEVVVALDRAIFDGCKDDGFRLVESQILCCQHTDKYNMLNLSVKCPKFEFGFPVQLVRKLVHI